MKVYIFGLHGIVSTTAIAVGKHLEKNEGEKRIGVVSELSEFSGIEKYVPFRFEFGGCEIRELKSSVYEIFLKHLQENNHVEEEYYKDAKEYMKGIYPDKGTALNCGEGVLNGLAPIETYEQEGLKLEEIVGKIEENLLKFAGKEKEETVAINIASTEPPLLSEKCQEYLSSLEKFEKGIKEDRKDCYSASVLYAYVCLKNGIPYANFTPSMGSSIPALIELAEKTNTPHAGNDGKTGETYVKSILAPMFIYRNLKIESWVGWNVLGDLDGKVLSYGENKSSKIKSKDKVISKIAGYQPYTVTDIDYIPPLKDNKIAMDMILFKAFGGKNMKLYFIWDAIDAVVAAPLALDIARFLLFAKKKKQKGIIRELAFFFKSPMNAKTYNAHQQFYDLIKWFKEVSATK